MSRGITGRNWMVTGLLLCAAQVASAAPIFTDSFESVASGSGTALPSNWVGISNYNNTRVYATNTKASDGTQSLFFYGNSVRVVGLKNALNVTGFSAIVISLDLSQAAQSYEGEGVGGADRFTLSVSFDGGSYHGVMTDWGAVDGLGTSTTPSEYSGTQLMPPSGSGTGLAGFASYYIQVDLPANTSQVNFQFSSSGSNDPEYYYMDNVVISGVVPEPASLALLAISGLLAMSRRCKA